MRAGGKAVDDDGRLARGQRHGVPAKPEDAAGLRDVEQAPVKREAVRQLEIPRDRHDVVGHAAPAAVGQRDDASLGGDRREQRPGGIDRQRARRAETGGEDVDAKSGGDGRTGHVRRGDSDQRDDETHGRDQRDGERHDHGQGSAWINSKKVQICQISSPLSTCAHGGIPCAGRPPVTVA